MPAALALVVCHAGFWLSPFALPDAFWGMLGHLGVEVFLVCLGYLQATTWLGAGEIRPVRLILRGILRLWPLYALLLGANVMLGPVAVTAPPSVLDYVFLVQNLASPHPAFFGEAWIVSAAMLVAVCVPPTCAWLRRLGFAHGVLMLGAVLLVGWVLRAIVVAAGDPAFDAGVRKILVLRLDLPFYGVLLAWLEAHRAPVLGRWRGALAACGAAILAFVAATHLLVPLDRSLASRIALPGLADIGWCMLLPWAARLAVPGRLARALRIAADSAYAGLLSHVTLLRAMVLAGVPTSVVTVGQGLLWLALYIGGATLVAVVLAVGVDRPWRAWLDRRLAQRPPGIGER